MVTTNSRFFLLLLILLSCTSSCYSFASSNRFILPRSISQTKGLNHGRSFHHLRKHDSIQEDVEGTTPRSAPLQASSMLIAAAPLKILWGCVLGIFGFLSREIQSLTFHQKMLFGATFVLGFFVGRLRPFWKRYKDINVIPSSLFGAQAPALRGRALKVSDGDTIRFLHQPTRWFHPSQLAKGQKLSEFALPIRLCTIDTPETAKFGKPGQPFGEEAKQYLKSLLQDKVVYIRLLQKDQYSRGVAEVFTGRFPFWQRHMDAEMLEKGLAEVYAGGGAVYGPLGKEEYVAIEDKARKAKKGIWSQQNRETAAEYKRRTKK